MVIGNIVLGSGDIFYLCLFLAVGVLGVVVHIGNRFDEKRHQEQVKEAQNWVFKDGITLLEGVRAYFGEDGDWTAAADDVCVWTQAPGAHFPNAGFSINTKTSQFMVFQFGVDASSMEINDTEDIEHRTNRLIEAMAQAVKNSKT